MPITPDEESELLYLSRRNTKKYPLTVEEEKRLHDLKAMLRREIEEDETALAKIYSDQDKERTEVLDRWEAENKAYEERIRTKGHFYADSICQHCERRMEIDMNEVVCFYCLYQIERRSSEGKNIWLFVLAMMVLVGLLIDLGFPGTGSLSAIGDADSAWMLGH